MARIPVGRPFETYVVVCLDAGNYYLATRRVFLTRDEADTYARTVAPTRKPLVVAGRFTELRIHAE